MVWFAGPYLVISGSAPLESGVSRIVLISCMLLMSAAVAAVLGVGERRSIGPTVQKIVAPEIPEAATVTVGQHMRYLGCYGYSIHQRDVVRINLPQLFVNIWSDWSHQLMKDGESRFGQQWISTYSGSTGYRFVLSAGVAGEDVWAGVMVPSRSSVGECLPLCIAASLPDSCAPVESFEQLSDWFDSVEGLVEEVLEDDFAIESLPARLQQLSQFEVNLYPPSPVGCQLLVDRTDPAEPASIRLSSSGKAKADLTQPGIVDAIMTQTFFQYSIWMTTSLTHENEMVTLISSGLPLGAQGVSLISRESLDDSQRLPKTNGRNQSEKAEAVPVSMPPRQSVDTARIEPSDLPRGHTVSETNESSSAGHTQLVTPPSRNSMAPDNDQAVTKPWKL